MKTKKDAVPPPAGHTQTPFCKKHDSEHLTGMCEPSLKIREARYSGVPMFVIEIAYKKREDAERHVRAVNSHEEQMALLKQIELYIRVNHPMREGDAMHRKIEQAIARAEGKK